MLYLNPAANMAEIIASDYRKAAADCETRAWQAHNRGDAISYELFEAASHYDTLAVAARLMADTYT